MTDEAPITVENLLARLQHGWDDFQIFLAQYSEQDLTEPRDAQGWSAKDHLAHLAVWARGVAHLLRRESRHGSMGISQEQWDRREINSLNAVLYDQFKDLPLAEVRAMLARDYNDLMDSVRTLTDADLLKPYDAYLAVSVDPNDARPIYAWVVGDGHEHLAEHKPWIAALIGK